MDSDSARASVESIKDDSECINVSSEPNLTGTCGDSSVREEGGGGEGVTDVNSSELVPPEPVSSVGEGEGAVLNPVAEISDVVEGVTSVDVVSSELSPAVTEVGGGGGEENAAFNVQEKDFMDLVGGGAAVVGEGGEEERVASIVKEGDFVAEGSDSQANLSGDKLEENKEVYMEEEPPSHDLSVYEVNGVVSLNAEEKREEGEQVVCGGMDDEQSSQAIESELGQYTESENEKVDAIPVEPSMVVGEGGEEERAVSIVKEGDSAAKGSDSPLNGGNMDREQANLSGDRLEENKENSMEEEPPSHDNGVDFLKAEEKRVESEKVVCRGMADEESSQPIESDLGQNTESEKEKVDVMEEETTAQAASLVNDIEIPDDKEVACVAGFTDIPSQDKELDDSVLNSGSEFVEKEPLKELQIGEGAKDSTDGDAKEAVDVTADATDIQVLKKSEEEEKVDGATVLEIETKPQWVDDVAIEVSKKIEAPVDTSSAVVTQFAGETSNDKETVMDDVKEDVEQDPEANKSVDIHVPEAEEEVETDVKYGAGIEKEGDGVGGAGEAGQTVDLEETREKSQELSEELAKVDETKISEVSKEMETMIKDEDEEKDDDMTDLVEDVETHGDSSVANIEEGREDHEDMLVTEMTETQEETVMGKVDGTKIAEVSEETEARIEDDDQEKDDEMTDVAEDVKTHGDSSVADIEGTIDMDLINTGVSASERMRRDIFVSSIRDIVLEKMQIGGSSMRLSELLEELKKHGGNINTEIHLHDVRKAVATLASEGFLVAEGDRIKRV